MISQHAQSTTVAKLPVERSQQLQAARIFVCGVPINRLRLRGSALTEATEQFFLLIRQTMAI
jgi:hypothetical protein